MSEDSTSGPQEPGSKRKRAPNYTTLEKNLILDLVSKYRKIIENNKTDGTTNQEKKETWIKISGEFNSSHGITTKRGWSNLKTTYENLKKNAKKNASSDKIKRKKTGGGDSPTKTDGISEKALSLMGPRVTPLANHFDSDAAYNNEEIDDEQIEGIVVEPASPANEGLHGMELVLSTTINANNEFEEIIDVSSGSAPPKETPTTSSSSKKWKNCWTGRRRPILKTNSLASMRLEATSQINEMAQLKSTYYQSKIENEKSEHDLKMQVLQAKLGFYSKKE